MLKILKWLGIHNIKMEEWVPPPEIDIEDELNRGLFVRRNDGLSRRMVYEYLLKKWDYRCAYCDKYSDNFEVDHIIPKSRKGTEKINNFVLSCHECNSNKSSLYPFQFKFPGSGRTKLSNYDIFPFRMIRYKIDTEKEWHFGEKENDFIPFGFSSIRINERKYLLYKSRRRFNNTKLYGYLRGNIILFGRRI